MKIIEALKELPLIKKKIEKNCESITKYASYITGLNLEFETEDKQKAAVASLVQGNLDLAKRFESLTNRLAKTNAIIIVDINGTKRTIREWITYRNVTADYIKRTYEALNTSNAQSTINKAPVNLEAGIKLTKLYNEQYKIDALAGHQENLDKVDATLEIVNVNTDLLEE